MTFEYLEPATIEEALERLADAGEDGVALAGATAFTVMYQQGLIRPTRVVGLRRIDALRGIRANSDGLWIGATTTHRQVEQSPLVEGHHAVIAETFRQVATVRIRNQATIGGNIAHADPSQDPPPTLIALEAVAEVAGRDGIRDIPLDGFFVDYLMTVLEPGELIVGLRVPAVPTGTRAAYAKYLPRSRDDYATVAVAAAVRLAPDGRIAAIRIVLGGAGPTPIRARAVEAALLGEIPTEARIADAAALVRDEVDPLDDARGTAAYKREMARVWVGRTVSQVAT